MSVICFIQWLPTSLWQTIRNPFLNKANYTNGQFAKSGSNMQIFTKRNVLLVVKAFQNRLRSKGIFLDESVTISISKFFMISKQNWNQNWKNWKCVLLGLLFQQTTTTFWPAILVQKNGWLCLGCSTPVSGQPEFSYLSHSSRQKKNPFTWEIQNNGYIWYQFIRPTNAFFSVKRD